MKGYLKRIVSAVLTLSVFFCAAVSIDASVFAADSGVSTASQIDVDEPENIVSPGGSDIDSDLVPCETTATEPCETTSPETTVPETTVPETTVPQTTVCETTIPATTAPPAPKVGKVTNFKKTGNKTNSITLSWDKTPGAAGYAVYCCNVDNSRSYKRLGYTKSTKYTAKNLQHTTAYYFKVAAYVDANGKRYEGPAVAKRTATQPPAPKVTLKSSSSSKTVISWSKNSKATGYKIYRACAATGGKYVAYKTITNKNTTTLTDKNVQTNRAYNYRVKVYRKLYSTNTYHSLYTQLNTVAGLGSVDFSMTSQLSKVSFSWKKNKCATGYDIYYSTSKNGTYKRIGTTKNDFYNSDKLKNGKTYYFRIRPYKLSGANKTKVVGSFLTKSKKVTNKAYGKNVGNTYIEISLKQQHMWFYVNGKLYCHTDVVTGNNDGYHNTPKGTYTIFQRQSPATLVGSNYVSYVKYWLGFTYSGVGIHDASWRSSGEYGGNTYKGNGSHGCVNTPLSAVKKIYGKARIGTYVVVY